MGVRIQDCEADATSSAGSQPRISIGGIPHLALSLIRRIGLEVRQKV